MPPRRRPPCLADSFRRLCSHGRLSDAVDALPALARAGIRIDAPSLAALLQQCLRAGALPLARRVHLHLRLTGLRRAIPGNTFLANQVLALHFACGRPGDARVLFDRMPVRNAFSYNAMLAGYAGLGMLLHARRMFDQMPEGVRDVVSWNTMIAALARDGGSCGEAVEFYVQMRRSLRGAFSAYSFSGLLVACARLGQPHLARQVHGQVVLVGYLSNMIISSSLVDVYSKCGCTDDARKVFAEMSVRDVLAWTTLVSGYAKSGDLASARRLFDEMPQKNNFSWAVLIDGYAQNGLSHEALDLFAEMMKAGLGPDQFTISGALRACTSISSPKHGKQIHAYLITTHFNSSAVVLSCLIDMYSKCGSLLEAQRVFDCVAYNKRDTVLWNTMIRAFGQYGYGERSIELFKEMVDLGTKPDSNTFVVVLTACSRSGLFAEGIQIFDSMAQGHGVYPEEEHYACFVDLLGQAGHFEEAMGRIVKTPGRSSVLVWSTLFAACRIHGSEKLVSEAPEHFIASMPQHSAPNALLSDMYADFGRWDSRAKARCILEESNVCKEQGVDLVEVESMV